MDICNESLLITAAHALLDKRREHNGSTDFVTERNWANPELWWCAPNFLISPGFMTPRSDGKKTGGSLWIFPPSLLRPPSLFISFSLCLFRLRKWWKEYKVETIWKSGYRVFIWWALAKKTMDPCGILFFNLPLPKDHTSLPLEPKFRVQHNCRVHQSSQICSSNRIFSEF